MAKYFSSDSVSGSNSGIIDLLNFTKTRIEITQNKRIPIVSKVRTTLGLMAFLSEVDSS